MLGGILLYPIEGSQWRRLLFIIAKYLLHPPNHTALHRAALAWRLVRVYELLTGRRSMISRESLASGKEHQRYDGTLVLRTLAEMGQTWAYTPIPEVIASTVQAYRLDRDA